MESTTTGSTIRVIAFGKAVEIINANSLTVEGMTDVNALKDWLSINFPGISELKISIAVNQKVVSQNRLFENGDEVALLPPFSGG
ncbi:MAG: MoaD/ThiS family protein [Bacteroidetes bacterium]|nr:MoaD/ThiS family protein [Bacteroidota bacterium]